MYGLVNQALQDMVTTQYGELRWRRILASAGVDHPAFVSMDAYDDAMTYSLVGATCEELSLPAADVLRSFGRWWVARTAADGYGEVLEMAGLSLPEFLANLDAMHARVALAMPHLRPPSFGVSEREPGRLLLHYRSHRAGLTWFVVGLIEGLGERFGTPCRVRCVTPRDDNGKEIFEVLWKSA